MAVVSFGAGYGAHGNSCSVPGGKKYNCTEIIPLNYEHQPCHGVMLDSDYHFLNQEVSWEYTRCKISSHECAHKCKSWHNQVHGKEWCDDMIPMGSKENKRMPCLFSESEVLMCNKGSSILRGARAFLSSVNKTFWQSFSDDNQYELLAYPYYDSSEIFQEPTYTAKDLSSECLANLDKAAKKTMCKKYEFESNNPSSIKNKKVPKHKRRS